MMPDHRRGIEPQRPTLLLQAPTDINVVTRDAELRIKSANRREARLAERHVTAGNVFRLAIGKQHVRGAAGRVGDAFGDGPIRRWRDVGSADRGVRRVHGIQERGRQIMKPMRIRISVVVEVGHDVAVGRLPSGVAGVAESAILSADHPAIILPRDGRGAVGGPVIHDDDFAIGIFEFSQALQTIANGPRAVVTANDH